MRYGGQIRARVATADTYLLSQRSEVGIELRIHHLFLNIEALSLQNAHVTLYNKTWWLARLQIATTTRKLRWFFFF